MVSRPNTLFRIPVRIITVGLPSIKRTVGIRIFIFSNKLTRSYGDFTGRNNDCVI